MENLYAEARREIDGITANHITSQIGNMDSLREEIVKYTASVSGIDAKLKYRDRHESTLGDLKVEFEHQVLPISTSEYFLERGISVLEAEKAASELLSEEIRLDEEKRQNLDVSY